MRRGWIDRLILAILLCGCGNMLFAQTVLFQGRVTDSLGGAINGALVTVTGAELTPRSRHVSYTFAY